MDVEDDEFARERQERNEHHDPRLYDALMPGHDIPQRVIELERDQGSDSTGGALDGLIARALGAATNGKASGGATAVFGRLRGAIVLGGVRREINAVARIGASFTGLEPQRFETRRMLWACFPDTPELAALEAQLAALEAQRAATQAERDLLAKELQAVYRSHSWRVTAPLRYVITGVRRLRPCVSLYFSRAANGALAFAATLPGHAAEGLRRSAAPLARRCCSGLFGWLTRSAGWWRLSYTRPRTVWGVTPILTLPLLAKCDRLLGFRSESLVFTVYHTTNSFDINLKALSGFVYRTFPRWIGKFHRAIPRLALIRYDVFHTFCDRGLLPASGGLQIEPAEMAAIRRHGRRLYAYTYGADVRTREATLALGRYNLCVECPEPGRFCTCDDEKGARNIAAIRQHATALVSMGDMLTYARDARNMHYWPIDTTKFPKTGTDWTTGRTLRIGHAPNHAHFKGTQFLVDAIERLKAQGYAIELVSVSGVANAEVIALFKSCDVVADQFIAGFHGYTALEAMALGKPVLCYLRDPQAAIDPA